MAKRHRPDRRHQRGGRVTPPGGRRVARAKPVAGDPAIAAAHSFLASASAMLLDDDPSAAEYVASMVSSMWLPVAGRAGDDRAASAPAAIDDLAATGRPEALGLLLALTSVAPEPAAAHARRAAELLAATGVNVPPSAGQLGQAQVTECWLMRHVLGDGDSVVLGCRYPSGHDHSLVVYIDHNLGTLVKDAFVAGPVDLVVKEFGEHTSCDPDTVIEPIDLADGAARIRQALELTDITIPPIDTDTYPQIRLPDLV